MLSTEIKIKTLTPLYTGGISGKMDRIHETSIIGSLRWWYESIARGLGGYSCDPVDNKCKFAINIYRNFLKENKTEKKALQAAGLCDACQVFGATGWKRRFNLKIEKDETGRTWEGNASLNVRPPGRTRGWYLPPGRTGNFVIKIEGDSKTVHCMATLFLFLEKWGAIGAKNQLGYGLFEIINRNEIENNALLWPDINEELNFPENINDDVGELPALDRLLFFQYNFQPDKADWWTRVKGLQRLLGSQNYSGILFKLAKNNMVPLSPVLKNMWRYEEWEGSLSAKKELMGISRGTERSRSKLSVSWAYCKKEENKWAIRGWLWWPAGFNSEIETFAKLLLDEFSWQKTLNLSEKSPYGPPEVFCLENKNDVMSFIGGGI